MPHGNYNPRVKIKHTRHLGSNRIEVFFCVPRFYIAEEEVQNVHFLPQTYIYGMQNVQKSKNNTYRSKRFTFILGKK